MSAALTRYRVLAWATGVFLLLLTLHVVLQLADYDWSGNGRPFTEIPGLGEWIPGAATWVPIVHGYLYLAYVVIAVDLWFRTRLPLFGTALVVLAGTVPGMSFVAERWVTAKVRPMIGGIVDGARPAVDSRPGGSAG